MFKPREILDHFRSMSGYIAFGCILFFAGIVVGGSNTAISDMMDQQLEAIAELAQQLDQSDNPTMSYILFIFSTMPLNHSSLCISVRSLD